MECKIFDCLSTKGCTILLEKIYQPLDFSFTHDATLLDAFIFASENYQ